MRFINCGLIVLVFLIGIFSSATAQDLLHILSNKIILQPSNNVLMDGNRKAFNAILEEMDNALNIKYTPCTLYEPTRPFLQVEGRRVSEIKCLQHIWDVKVQEETKNKIDQCQATMGQQLLGIVGGRKSQPGEFPHMGAVGWKTEERGKYEFKCGSFLISNKFALTAAHCSQINRKTPKIVRFGVVNVINDKINPSLGPVDVRILNFITHPSYRPNFKAFDIAVIELAKKVTFNDYIQPVCILDQNVDQAIISGWGVDKIENENAGKTSEDLQVAQVDVLDHETCKKKWMKSGKLDNMYWPEFLDSQMCAVKMTGTKADTCSGDSGGPLQSVLQVNTKRKIYNVIGVTSTSAKCGSIRFPSVFTRVSSFIDWIEEVVWGVKSEFRKTGSNEKTNDTRDPEQSEAENEIDTSDKHFITKDTSENDINYRIMNENDTSDKHLKTIDTSENEVNDIIVYENDTSDKHVKTKDIPENDLYDRIFRIKDVEEYDNGVLFWFDSTKGSNWAYIDKSELENHKQQ
ncbi:hypothetical protein O0L34_g15345 [Tuta absoluta]|nr:hypothetical protein O0L34_g15345 [Tuta absoluta]